MYNLFTRYWRTQAPLALIDQHTQFTPFRPPPPTEEGTAATAPGNGSGYVAVKFYWSACFPDRPENRAFVARTLRALASRNDVVLLDTGLALDDHGECEAAVEGRVHRIRERIVPSRNLELQSQLVAGARAFVGTYGGFSYLAASYGVPALALYSEPEGFLPVHRRVAERAYRRPPFAPLRFADARDVDGVSWMWNEPAA
jgi:ADP-heptose:LPS heptosyltransferase